MIIYYNRLFLFQSTNAIGPSVDFDFFHLKCGPLSRKVCPPRHVRSLASELPSAVQSCVDPGDPESKKRSQVTRPLLSGDIRTTATVSQSVSPQLVPG